MKTLRLYQKDVYLKKTEAMVLNILKTEEDCKAFNKKFEKGTFLLELDQSLFFPEGGGQPFDLGKINGLELTEVLEDKETGTIWHRVKAGEISLGKAFCELDWQRRFDHMQMHCGEHVLSGSFYKLFGIENRGFHMGKGFVTIDMALPENSQYKEITAEMVKEAELYANEAIWKNLPVTTKYFDTREEANSQPVRKAIKFDEDISVVFCGSNDDLIDCCACCGTHPAYTGEIGSIRVLRSEKYKGMLRLHCKMGRFALLDAIQRTQITSNLCKVYSAELFELESKVALQEEKNGLIKKELYDLKKNMQADEAEKLRPLLKEEKLFKTYTQFSAEELQGIAHILEKDITGLLVLCSEKENSIVLASLGNPSCGAIVKEFAKLFNGKGGGSPKLARALFTNKNDLKGFLEKIK